MKKDVGATHGQALKDVRATRRQKVCVEAVLRSRSRSEPLLFGWLHLTVDKTDEFLNDILFVSSHIDKRLV